MIITHLITPNNCLLNIFFNALDLISQHCNLDLLHKPTFPHSFVYALQSNEYLIYSPKTNWTVSCPSNLDKSLTNMGSLTVSLQCRCQLNSASNLFTAVDLQCLEAAQSEYKYSANWFLYETLYQQARPEHLNPSVLHTDPVDFQLPSLLVDVAKLRRLEKSDETSNRHAFTGLYACCFHITKIYCNSKFHYLLGLFIMSNPHKYFLININELQRKTLWARCSEM